VDFQQFDPFNYLVYPADFLSLPFEYPDPLKTTLKPYLQALEISKDAQEYAERLLEEVNQQAPEFLILSLIHISEPTRLRRLSYAVFCLKQKNGEPSGDDNHAIKKSLCHF